MNILILPNHILKEIFHELDKQEQQQLRSVCKEFNCLIIESDIYIETCIQAHNHRKETLKKRKHFFQKRLYCCVGCNLVSIIVFLTILTSIMFDRSDFFYLVMACIYLIDLMLFVYTFIKASFYSNLLDAVNEDVYV